MKTKLRLTIAAFGLAIFNVSTATVHAQGFEYVTNNGTLEVARCTCLVGPVDIPSWTNGLPVTSIAQGAFSGCGLVTSVGIPDTVTNIGNLVFHGCNFLQSITVAPVNVAYSSEDGVLFNKSGTMLVQYPEGKRGTYSITTNVIDIARWAFYSCDELTSITIPNSVDSIGDYAFSRCTSLAAIMVDELNAAYSSSDGVLFTRNQDALIQYPCGKAGAYIVPNGVKNIGSSAFALSTGLTAITIPSSVTSIGQMAFSSCTSLSSVTIPDSITQIAYSVFCGCTSLTNVTIPNSVTSIGEYAFDYCSKLLSVTIPESVTSIGDGAFSRCTSVTDITVGALNPAYSSLEGVLFTKNRDTLIQYPGGKAGPYIVPDSVTNIGSFAFGDCIGLTGITIPPSVSIIGQWAFANCSGLATVTIPNSVTSVGYGAFESCGLMGSITIGNSVTNIETRAFFGCSSLTNVTIPNGVRRIGAGAFGACANLSAIDVDPENPVYSSLQRVLFNNNQTALVQFPGGKTGSYTVPGTVITIDDGAFIACAKLTRVEIPDSVTRIESYAFAGCSGLTSIIIPKSVTDIGNSAFSDCIPLSAVYFEGNAPTAGEDVFHPYDITNLIAMVYYLPGTTGWGTTFGGRQTAPWVLPYPVALTTTPRFGITNNAFGFRISWATNASVVIEASTELGTPAWLPVSTNTLIDGWSYFSDPEWTNYPKRFYRIRAQ